MLLFVTFQYFWVSCSMFIVRSQFHWRTPLILLFIAFVFLHKTNATVFNSDSEWSQCLIEWNVFCKVLRHLEWVVYYLFSLADILKKDICQDEKSKSFNDWRREVTLQRETALVDGEFKVFLLKIFSIAQRFPHSSLLILCP